MKILHIAAHLGGGIGSAYIGLGACGQEQSVLLLEDPIDLRTLAKVENTGFNVLKASDGNVNIAKELSEADVVIFSWYHHPALTRFLRELPRVPIRGILWSHVSGNYFPAIEPDFVKKFDRAIFTSPYSLGLEKIKLFGEDYINKHFGIVYGLNDLSLFYKISKKPHKGFNIGYVGTLGYCKLHPEFVDFCAGTDLPDARFVMAGNPSTKEQILTAAAKKGIASQFEFLGYVSDVPDTLSRMDVFGYLLNPRHFGTTENALLEAMAAGLPVVALDQCVERYIIRDGVTGLLVRSPEEYGNALRRLYKNPEECIKIGRNARAEIMERFEIKANRERFLNACLSVLDEEKRIHRFDDFFKGEPADWFLSCVNDDRECFEENRPQDAGLIFRESTKGSPRHYHKYFPADKRLAGWAGELSKLR